MQKHAVTTPMKPGLFFAKHPSRDVFDIGPFASIESALDELPSMLQEVANYDVLEIGEMVAFQIPQDIWNEPLLQMKREGRYFSRQTSLGWCETITKTMDAHGAELRTALHTMLMGWLTIHAAHPAFGSVRDVRMFSLFDGKIYPFGETPDVIIPPRRPELTALGKELFEPSEKAVADILGAGPDPEPVPAQPRCGKFGGECGQPLGHPGECDVPF